MRLRTPCGPKYADGSFSAYKQADGTCESPVERGDTYGPVMYAAYVPMTATLGWSGRWDDLPAAHGTAVLFDALAAAGLGEPGAAIELVHGDLLVVRIFDCIAKGLWRKMRS